MEQRPRQSNGDGYSKTEIKSGIMNFVNEEIIARRRVSITNLLQEIGADDIFVFYDSFDTVGHEHPACEHDYGLRLAMTFRRATAAMLVTSASTALSFYANIVSTLPVIKEFGIFMGMVVTINFITVIIYFPTLVIMDEKINRLCCCSKNKVLVKKNKKNLKELQTRDSMILDDEDNLNEFSIDNGDDVRSSLNPPPAPPGLPAGVTGGRSATESISVHPIQVQLIGCANSGPEMRSGNHDLTA